MEEALIKRVLPHSVEAEQSVIGAMLMDQEAIIKAYRDHKRRRFLSASVRHCF